MRSVLLVTTALLAVAAAASAAELTWSPADPVEGEAVTVTVTVEDRPAAGASVRAVYQPESEVARTEEVGVTGADGTLRWTPVRGGVVRLIADAPVADTTLAISQTLSVRFGGVPWTGLLVMAVAGLVLYGGVIRGFRLLSSAPPPSPPDT